MKRIKLKYIYIFFFFGGGGGGGGKHQIYFILWLENISILDEIYLLFTSKKKISSLYCIVLHLGI